MNLDLYQPQGRSAAAPTLPAPTSSALARPEAYHPDAALVDAVNVALVLGQPLLLTGEPGCGKTQLATHLAWALRMEPLVTFETKSDSTAESLFYRYDALRHFEASSRGHGGDPLQYVRFHALGAAILATLPPDQWLRVVTAGSSVEGADGAPDRHEPHRSVVLVDEIDKAPRDFPNDVLNEIEHLYFRIPECGNLVLRADDRFRPVVVITSNSERDLPEPFLRRCVFHHIDFPDEETIRRIALGHLGERIHGLDPLLDDAVALYLDLRAESVSLMRRPGLAEFLNWLVVLGHDRTEGGRLDSRRLRSSLGVLVKTAPDLARASAVVDAWLARRAW